jgi:hypothetical protein
MASEPILRIIAGTAKCSSRATMRIDHLLRKGQDDLAPRLTTFAIFMCSGNVLQSECSIDNRANRTLFH